MSIDDLMDKQLSSCHPEKVSTWKRGASYKWSIAISNMSGNTHDAIENVFVEAIDANDMSGRDRMVLELTLQGYTSKEIAEMVGVSEKAIRNDRRRIVRGRKKNEYR